MMQVGTHDHKHGELVDATPDISLDPKSNEPKLIA